VYGIAAGPKAVGSIAIDEVTFGPSAVKMKQAAQYGFHSHSDFSDVRADFMFTGLKDNHIVMKQDNETPLSPVTPDEHAQGSLQSKGTEGQHLLQIRAWRGNSASVGGAGPLSGFQHPATGVFAKRGRRQAGGGSRQ
jgi:hypothetical protein